MFQIILQKSIQREVKRLQCHLVYRLQLYLFI